MSKGSINVTLVSVEGVKKFGDKVTTEEFIRYILKLWGGYSSPNPDGIIKKCDYFIQND